jgi:UPF0042 nucleotide-binding protein
MEIIIITGLSGAGKSQAADYFEDIGYYCIDNMPPSLIKSFVELIRQGKHSIHKAAFVVDIRGGEFFDDMMASLSDLKQTGIAFRILFLDAADETLLRRFSETRRAHPLAEGTTNEEAIQEERRKLEPIRRVSDFMLDTSQLNNPGLAEALRRLLTEGGEGDSYKIVIQSFGYKYGIPKDADIVLDMRFIPNPFYVDSLRKLTGNSKKVRDYILRAPEVKSFIDEVLRMMRALKPAYLREGKHGISIAFGCTGGQHRSVAIANIMHERLRAKGEDAVLKHRDI